MFYLIVDSKMKKKLTYVKLRNGSIEWFFRSKLSKISYDMWFCMDLLKPLDLIFSSDSDFGHN